MAEAQATIPAPEPPLEETNLGLVPNPGRAEYQRDHKKWLKKLDELTFNATLDLGVKRFPIPEDALAQLEGYKEILKEPPYRKEIEQSDWVSYLTMILMPDPKECQKLVQDIIKLSNPTAEQVEAQREQFQPDLAGGGSLVDQSTALAAVG